MYIYTHDKNQWRNNSLGASMKDVHSSLYHLILPTSLTEALCIIPVEEIENYCQYYLHDFIQAVHHISHSQTANELEVRSYDIVILLQICIIICRLLLLPFMLILKDLICIIALNLSFLVLLLFMLLMSFIKRR